MPDMKSYKSLIVLAVAGLVFALAVVGLLLTQRDAPKDLLPKPSLAVREAAPGFTLALLEGGNFQLGAYKGKPVLINFFASWCLPCREEMPAIERIVQEYRPKGVVFLGISTDDTEANARDFIRKYGVTFPIGIDSTAGIQNSYGLYGIPTTYFVDKQGMVNYLHSGNVTEELLRHELDKLL